MVVQLNALGILAAGGGEWSLAQLQRVFHAPQVDRGDLGSEAFAASGRLT